MALYVLPNPWNIIAVKTRFDCSSHDDGFSCCVSAHRPAVSGKQAKNMQSGRHGSPVCQRACLQRVQLGTISGVLAACSTMSCMRLLSTECNTCQAKLLSYQPLCHVFLNLGDSTRQPTIGYSQGTSCDSMFAVSSYYADIACTRTSVSINKPDSRY